MSPTARPRNETSVLRPLLLANFADVVGGGEIGFQMLANGLRARNHAPIVTIPGEGSLIGAIPGSHPAPSAVSGGALEVRHLASDCDLIHTFSTKGALTAILAKTGKPILFHALIPNRDPMDPVIAPHVAAIVCNSEATRHRFRPFAATRLLYNGVADPMPAEHRLGLRPGQKTILIAGPTAPRKGHRDALPALETLLSNHPDIDVAFAGNVFGSVGLAVREFQARWPDRVQHLGFVPDLANHLHEADLVIIPSRSEGFGRIAVEALLAGTPVLATRVDGLPEALAGHADPFLPDDRSQWADRIQRELRAPTHPAEDLRQAGARFAPDRFLDGVIEIYRDVLAARGGATPGRADATEPKGHAALAPSPNGPVTASLASIPARQSQLEQVVTALLPQVDRLNVYLNGYVSFPSWLDHPKITVARSQDAGDRGDAGKFYWSVDSTGYLFSCDDDLAYPPDYVRTMVAAVERHGRQALVCCHGDVVSPDFTRAYDKGARRCYPFAHRLDQDMAVHIGGTGVMAYHSDTLRVDRASFQSLNLADIWVGVLAQRLRIPIVCIERPAGWVTQLPGITESIYSNSRQATGTVMDSSAAQTDAILAHMPWRLHYTDSLIQAAEDAPG